MRRSYLLQPLGLRCVAWLLLAAATAPVVLRAQQAPDRPTEREVRQLVTFLFQPGRTSEALAIYEAELLPIYRANEALLRFRAYREVESPVPLDLVIVSSFRGLAGMDASNAALRASRSGGRPVLSIYGALAGMSQHHHDQFFEMLPTLSDTAIPEIGLTVFEYVRVAPGAAERYEAVLDSLVRPLERARGGGHATETGRALISDGWDYLRVHRVASLGAWHSYLDALRTAGRGLHPLVAARRTVVLRVDPRFSVR